jgi:son of sevenless-like protein
MTQTAVSALVPQAQNHSNTSYNSGSKTSATTATSTTDRRFAASSAQSRLAKPVDSASLDDFNTGRDNPSYTQYIETQASTAWQSPDRNITQNSTSMNGIAGSAPPGAMYVRALYDYEADDRTSLSFHEGDIIQVITQLESGWWDGVINGVRGWFPSNYCQIINSPDELPGPDQNGGPDPAEEEPDDGDVYEEGFDEDEGSDQDDFSSLPLQETEGDKSRADFWIPQATSDGRLFYYNTMTGESSMELPLESPSSVTETGPRDRMNASMPDKTRPPPELMARGLMQDEEDESDVNSASELEGESIMLGSRSSLVSFLRQRHFFFLACSLVNYRPAHGAHMPMGAWASRPLSRWTPSTDNPRSQEMAAQIHSQVPPSVRLLVP